MIGWLIVLGILALLLGLLLSPLVFALDYDDPKDRFFWKLSWLGIEPETEEKPEHTDKKGKLKRYWKIAQNSLSVLPKPLRRLWKGLSLRHLIVGVQVGRFDAKECALAYGAANAAVYAAVGLLSSAMRVHLEQLTVQCAFGQERSRWVIRGRLHFCPLSALLALGSFAMGYVMQKNRQEDAEKEPAAEKNTLPPDKQEVKKCRKRNRSRISWESQWKRCGKWWTCRRSSATPL